MTLEELDKALADMGLAINSESGQAVRDRILASYGSTLVESKQSHCQNCWHREHDKCLGSCQFHEVGDDPLKAAQAYLGRPNDVNLVAFICMFVIPLYERETGKTGVMERIAEKIKRHERAR